MKAKGMVRCSLLLALALILLTASYAFGCIPDDEIPDRCGKLPKATPEQRPVALAAPSKPQPRGDSPATAIEPTGTWQFIGPYTSVWYKMNDAGLQLEIWLDAYGQSGLSMAIYAPDQKDLYGKPIGRGTFSRFQPHDLFWTGRSSARGTWYALVTNNTPVAISYSVNYKRVIHSAADRCSTCHGFEIEWDRCESAPGSSWCSDLQKEYGQ
jgi:hypothetical protein